MRFKTSPRARTTGNSSGARSADARPSFGRRLVSVFATALVAVLVGSGLAVVGAAAPASAHTPNISATCDALSVSLTNYNGLKGDANTVKVTIDDVVVAETAFAQGYVESFQFSDRTIAHTYSVEVSAHDDPDGSRGWSVDKTGSSAPCVEPTVELVASACTEEGGTSDLTATITGVEGRVYSALLSRDGVVTGDKQTVDGSGTITWTDQEPGGDYTVTVTDPKDPYLELTATATADECSGVDSVSLEPQTCLAPGDEITLLLTADGLAVGREYELIVRSGDDTVAQIRFTADTELVEQEVPVPAGSTGLTAQLYIVDAETGLHSPVGPELYGIDAGTCPVVVEEPVVTVEACTLGGTDSGATIELAGLAEGREYQLLIDGTESGEAFIADATGTRSETVRLAPGEHTVAARDTAAPDVVSPSASVTVEACPAVPTLALDIEQCTAPGGPAGFTATLTDLVPTRDYELVVTSGDEVLDTVTVSGATDGSYSWAEVPVGAAYTVTVTDVAEPDATATAEAVLEECPPAPGLSATSSECTTENGTSTITTVLSDLAPDRDFTVSLQRDDDGTWVTVQSVTGVTSASAPPSFVVPAPVDATYRVTVADTAGEFTAETLVSVAACSGELGGGENPPGVPTTPAGSGGTGGLATTGSDATLPALGGLLALQLGLGFIGYSILRRRMTSGT